MTTTASLLLRARRLATRPRRLLPRGHRFTSAAQRTTVRTPPPQGRRALVAACVLALMPAAAWAQTGELAGELGELTGERDRAEEQLDSLRQREGDARTQLAAVEAELEQADADLTRSVEALERAQRDLADAEQANERAHAGLEDVLAELELSEKKLAAATDTLEVRVVAAYKYGNISFTEAFAGVRDMADFISSSIMVARVLDGDRVMVEEFTSLHQTVEAQRTQAQKLRAETERALAAAATAAAEIETATDDRARALAAIEKRRAEREELFLALRDDRQAAEGHLTDLEAESQRIADQLAVIAQQQDEAAEDNRQEEDEAAEDDQQQDEAAEDDQQHEDDQQPDEATEDDRQEADAEEDADQEGDESASEDAADDGGAAPGPPPPPSGEPDPWARPAPGPLTSPFGPRWGRNHNGVDIGGGEGTAIVASRSGTVVTVISSCHPTNSWGCGGGFGNYVTVSHADGMATIYAHLASVSVGAGQQVEAGQVLGTMGNSGSSLGRHLHFEVREAGVPHNPCNYIAC